MAQNRGTIPGKHVLADDWGVYVNEVAIFATGIGADKRAEFQLRAHRLTMLRAGLGGAVARHAARKRPTEARDIFIDRASTRIT